MLCPPPWVRLQLSTLVGGGVNLNILFDIDIIVYFYYASLKKPIELNIWMCYKSTHLDMKHHFNLPRNTVFHSCVRNKINIYTIDSNNYVLSNAKKRHQKTLCNCLILNYVIYGKVKLKSSYVSLQIFQCSVYLT